MTSRFQSIFSPWAAVRAASRAAALAAILLPALAAAPLAAQSPASSAAPAPIDQYIRRAWDTLSRSMSECKSVIDTKVATTPVLYLPYAMATPPAVVAMQKHCSVQVAHLPRKITRMGDVKVAEIPREGLLYLPNRYVVPGGRFNEMYGWDSYFIVLGLVHDGRIPLAKGIVENFFFEIDNYGSILNANRTYFFTRSQPPLLSSMIAEVYSRTHDKVWLARAYEFATRDHNLWTRAPHLAGDTGLARFDDLGDGPVPEMADDSTYYPDVVKWLLAHPKVKTDYLVEAPEHPDPAQAARLAKTSCDLAASHICAAAYADGHRLSAAFYHGDRAMRESGFDTSFRFGPFSGSTQDYAPVGLNSLLYKYEQDLASFATELGHPSEAAAWKRVAHERQGAITHFLWRPDLGRFYDYNFVTRKPSGYNFITTFYPLWAGLATPAQAAAVDQHVNVFEHDGGMAMSDNDSGTQWDLPFGWAPTNWFSSVGLARYGFHADAGQIARRFMNTVASNYRRDGTLREKYNVVSGSANVQVAAGYKANVIGFGWTNGVYVSLESLLAHEPPGHEPPAQEPPAQQPPAQEPAASGASTAASSPAPQPPATLLSPDELQKLIPATVFFRGQSSTVQIRNAGGVRFGADSVLLAVKVDTGGYSTSIQEKYQDYLISEVPIALGDHTLPPGAYGAGFVGNTFLVMDLGGNTLFTVPSITDAKMRRPRPLQIVAGPSGRGFRLYGGRQSIAFARAAQQ